MTKITRLLLIIIIFWGAILRLYQSSANFQFEYEQSDDVLVTQDLWQKVTKGNWRHVPLRGQVGSFITRKLINSVTPFDSNPIYHGVFYYFLLMPFGVLFNFHPFGIALFFILSSIVTIYLMFLLGQDFFNEEVGLVAAFLTATNFRLNLYSRWIWTPSLMPFFVCLSLLGLVKVIKGHDDFKYWFMLVFGAASASQIHNSGYWFLGFMIIQLFIFKPKIKERIKTKTAFLLLIFALILGPTIVNELMTGFRLEQAVLWQVWSNGNNLALLESFKLIAYQFLHLVNIIFGLVGDFPNRLHLIFIKTIALAAVFWSLIKVALVKKGIKKIFLYWFLLFLPIPMIAGLYFGPLSQKTTSLLNALLSASSFLILLLANVLVNLAKKWNWLPLLLFFITMLTIINTELTADMLWRNNGFELNYGSMVKTAQAITDHSSGEKYHLSAVWGEERMDNFVHVLLANNLPLPETFNGQSYWSSLEKPLANQPTSRNYIVLFKSSENKSLGELIFNDRGYKVFYSQEKGLNNEIQ
jgi:hypothetical protein